MGRRTAKRTKDRKAGRSAEHARPGVPGTRGPRQIMMWHLKIARKHAFLTGMMQAQDLLDGLPEGSFPVADYSRRMTDKHFAIAITLLASSQWW